MMSTSRGGGGTVLLSLLSSTRKLIITGLGTASVLSYTTNNTVHAIYGGP